MGVEVGVGGGVLVGGGGAADGVVLVGVESHHAAFGVDGFDAVFVGARVHASVGALWDGDGFGAGTARGLVSDSGGGLGDGGVVDGEDVAGRGGYLSSRDCERGSRTPPVDKAGRHGHDLSKWVDRCVWLKLRCDADVLG